MKVFRFLYNLCKNWRNRKRGHAGSASMRMLQAYSGIERLERSALLRVNTFEPFVDIDMELHLTMNRNTDRYQQFWSNLHRYINYRRSAFNGAASEGYAVAPDGRTHLSPIQPGDAVNFHVYAGNALICVGAFNQYNYKVETYKAKGT